MKNMSAAVQNDSELVGLVLAGNRDAFAQIVSRYQSLICSLAYSATGSLGQSEDLAQETFITAWKRLNHLREREKLRPWLCGIARNRINSFLRREGREPLHKADSMDEITESHSTELPPADHVISKEEEAILWRSLERIPEIYREPLILFYREHQSIETVAVELDLTEDAVKQRLSRGRKLLQEQVLAFVEGALTQTNPGRTFTLGVLSLLPATLKSSALATAAVKGSGMKASALGVFSMLLSPLMILFGNYIPYRTSLAEASSDEERAYIKSFYRKVWAWSFGLSLVAFLMFWLTSRRFSTEPLRFNDLFGIWFVMFVVLYLFTMFFFAIINTRPRRRYYAKILSERHGGVIPKPSFEFCSRIRFLGLPLIHIRLGSQFDDMRRPVKAWIACGNYCIGGLFAFGAIAVAPFSIGGLAIGLIPLGGIVAGIFPLGGLSVGIFAFGGIAIGWQAIGGFALAWNQAMGNLALARDFAIGHFVHALQANTEIAKKVTGSNPYFQVMQSIARHWFWMNFVWITPLFIQWKIVSRSRRIENAKAQACRTSISGL